MSESTAYRVKIKIPRQYSFVRFDVSNQPKDYRDHFKKGRLVFSPRHRYIFMGEIPNMPGHCVVADDNGKMYTGYHIENFIELTDDEQAEYLPVGYRME